MRGRRFFLLSMSLFFFFAAVVHAEEMVITTYYPSPSGSYDALLSKRFAVGDVNEDGSVNASDIPATDGFLLVADRVGIGTASPNDALEVGGTFGGLSGSRINIVDPSSVSGYGFGEDSNYRAWILWDNSSDRVSMGLANAGTLYGDILSFIAPGKVGIGTSAPETELQIGGYSAACSITIASANSQTSGGGLKFSETAGFGSGFFFDHDTSNNKLYVQGWASSAKVSDILTLVRDTGYVGVGTTGPDAKFNIQGGTDVNAASGGFLVLGDLSSTNIGFDDNEIMARSNGAVASLYLQHEGGNTIMNYGGGSVAIGTTTPNANMKLQAAGEICSSILGAAGGNIRMIHGNYGCFIRNDGSNTYFLLTNSGDQYGGWNSLRPLYINNASGYVTFGNGHGDLAENYHISGTALRGSLMSVDSSLPSTAVKAGPLNRSLLGVISTTPGAVMDTDGGFHIGYGTKSAYKDEKAPVVLSGAAPLLVTSQNGAVSIGDPVGISSVPGFGAKAVSAGWIAGMALEAFPPRDSLCKKAASIEAIKWPEDDGKNSKRPCFKLPDGTYVGKIMAAVNVAWYDPAAGASGELIKEMRGEISELNAAVKMQEQEIRVLKEEMNRLKK